MRNLKNISFNILPLLFVIFVSIYSCTKDKGLLQDPNNNSSITGSTNNQNQWKRVNSGISNTLNSVCFVNSEIGYIAGNNGTILKTFDGGLSWESLNTPTNKNFISVQFTSTTIGYLYAKDTFLYKTIDGGNTWQTLAINHSLLETSECPNFYSGFPSNVHFISDNVGFYSAMGFHSCAGTFLGGILKTVDGGITWVKKNSSFGRYGNFCQIDDQHEINFPGIITNDEGETWHNFYPDSNITCSTGMFPTLLNGFVCGSKVENEYTLSARLIKTNDGGNSWQSCNTPFIQDNASFNISFQTKDKGFLYSLSDLYSTVNGGNTWKNENIFKNESKGNQIKNMAFSTDSIAILVGTNGMIFRGRINN